MATTPNNNIVRSVAPDCKFESAKALISSSSAWNQGDLLFLDTTAHLIKPVAADATDAVSVLGVARQTISSGKVVSPYQGTAVDAAAAIEDIAGPVFGVVAKMQLKSGDTFNPGAKVYLVDGAAGANAQSVTSVDPGSHVSVGAYQDAVVTAGASSFGNIYIVCNY